MAEFHHQIDVARKAFTDALTDRDRDWFTMNAKNIQNVTYWLNKVDTSQSAHDWRQSWKELVLAIRTLK